jgi:hypothetical protein
VDLYWLGNGLSGKKKTTNWGDVLNRRGRVCKICEFWEIILSDWSKGKQGTCHCRPGFYPDCDRFPVVSADNWCGDFKLDESLLYTEAGKGDEQKI